MKIQSALFWTVMYSSVCLTLSFQMNEWKDDWVTFFSQQRLQYQLSVLESTYGDREARELWAQLQVTSLTPSVSLSSLKMQLTAYVLFFYQLKIPQFFKDVEIIPALLHGDLWGGNVAECAEGPVIFDPASFYGHSEFELSISKMFGGFDESFFTAYHTKIPQASGFANRNQLYQLFHYVNHWNHFGGGYRGSSIRIMKNLVK